MASHCGIVVTVGDSNADEITAAETTKSNAEADLVSLNAQLTPLVAIAGLEQLGLNELNAALGAAETGRHRSRPTRTTPRRTTTPPTRRRACRFRVIERGPGCPDRGRHGG